MKQLKNLKLSSWTNDGLCDVIWAALLHRSLGRERCLAAFRVLLTILRRERDRLDGFLFTHSSMSALEHDSFDIMFADFIQVDEVSSALSPLLLLSSLPDRAHWDRHLSTPKEDEGWHFLAEAVADVFDHQSQASTDIRWLKPMALMARDRLKFPSSLADRAKEIVEYPRLGDMRSVRPRIRAQEIGIRSMADEEGKGGASWSEAFWREGWERTLCLPTNIDDEAVQVDHQAAADKAIEIYDALMGHFVLTTETTGVDARHDASFGLVLYVLQLLLFSLQGATGQTVVSRFVLRTAVECFITLAYLQTKDDSTIWLQYRTYGAGQARLALLKLEDSTDMPTFITKDLLNSLANEDTWHEYLDIKLGSWSDKNVRQMSEEAGVKHIYDRYYDSLSTYIHGSWGATRHVVFCVCLNPLHRFHRLPMPPRLFGQDATPDLCKILNLCLDRLASLFPPFTLRFPSKRN